MKINNVEIKGNKRTKEIVFLRETGIKKGDSIFNPDSTRIVWQKRLSGLNIFNYVDVNIDSGNLKIEVLERIYIWAMPRLAWADRNFNVWWQTKDLDRLIYGATAYFNNIRGLNNSLQVTLISGYNREVSLLYNIPFRRYSGGWSYQIGGTYWTNHELWIDADNDVLRFLSLPEKKIQTNAGFEVVERKRHTYFSRTEFSQGWNFIEIDSSAFAKNPKYLFNGNRQNEYFMKVEYVNDRRDQRDYPTRGHLLRGGVKMAQYGNLNSGVNRINVFIRGSWFNTLSGKYGTVLAAMAGWNWVNGYVPYKNARQLGYKSDYVRGYEPYVGDGRGFYLGKLGIRQPLVHNRTIQFLRSGLFSAYTKIPISLWFNIFADAGAVIHPWDPHENPISQGVYRGWGLGLDIIAWYTAMARFEYSINHLGKGNFNLSFKNAF